MTEYGLNTILMTFAGVTILLASLLAFKQDNLKRRLAYSTVGHLSYIILGLSVLSATAIAGGVLHLAFHATLKITLFFCAGAIYVAHHKENVSQLDGIGKMMPWTMAAFTLGTVGLAGIPPLNGFLSKWYMGIGSLEIDRITPVLILMLSGLLNAGYLFPIVLRAYFRPAPENPGHGVRKEAPPLMVVPLVLTAILSLVLGLAPNLVFKFMHLAQNVAAQILHGAGL
jgi:multicomponent Na+:H+ antiporter subunit D